MTAHLKPAELEAITPIVEQKVVNLALQGGGSHGAFTWGVLDRLLEDERLAFDGITATSAGAVNAVVLADGLALGGREGARNALKNFWQKTSQMASSSIIAPSFFDQMNPKFGLEHTPAYVFIDVLSRILSPYQLNPMDINPLKDLLNAEVNFERVRQQKVVKLFLSATNVRSGKVKVFAREEIAADHVLASACLPFMMRAPEIDGEALLGRWVHGESGNLSGDLRMRGSRHHHGSSHADRAVGAPDQLPQDHQSHARDQLQFIAHAGDANDCFGD